MCPANDVETEERLVSGDVVGRRVATHEQSAGNIDEPEGASDYEE